LLRPFFSFHDNGAAVVACNHLLRLFLLLIVVVVASKKEQAGRLKRSIEGGVVDASSFLHQTQQVADGVVHEVHVAQVFKAKQVGRH
jgi:hypothetical protein